MTAEYVLNVCISHHISRQSKLDVVNNVVIQVANQALQDAAERTCKHPELVKPLIQSK